jgi:lactate dehydrogenase-like 2-hydroxyacid dehydrogenase
MTPHLGYVTEGAFRARYSQMVEGLEAWFKGEPLRRLV